VRLGADSDGRSMTAADAPGTPVPSIMSPARKKTRSADAGGFLLGRADRI